MPRLPFTFPFFEDEIFFFWLVRYHCRSANRISEYTSKEIFGCVPNVRPDRIFLLDKFCEATGFDSDEIIENHSTLPYYRSSYSPEKFQDLIRQVKEEGQVTYPMYGAGVAHQTMKYCPVCAREEIENYGIPYWHVSHNLDGITICPKHQVRLLNDNTTFTSRRRTYALPPFQEDDPVIVEDGPDELRFNALISDAWRVERYSKKEILTLIRVLAKIQHQEFGHFQWLKEQIISDQTVIKIAENRGIDVEDLAPRIERLLKDPKVPYHPFYTYLVRDYLGLTRETAEMIVEVYPGVFDSIR